MMQIPVSNWEGWMQVPKSATSPNYYKDTSHSHVRQYKVADSEFASACLIHGLPVKIITDNNPLTYVPM